MATSQKIAVAGATGRVGRHVVDVLGARGHDVVPMSRALGVDVITGEGLDAALAGVDCVIDAAATGPSPEEQAATEFFITASHNLHDAGGGPAWTGCSSSRSSGPISFTGVRGGEDRPRAAIAGRSDPGPRAAGVPVPRVRRAARRLGDARATPRTSRPCAPSSSRPGPSPRCSPTSPPRPSCRPEKFPRSPARAKRASSRWRGCSSACRGVRRGSRTSTTRATPTHVLAANGGLLPGPGRDPRRPDLRRVAGRGGLSR